MRRIAGVLLVIVMAASAAVSARAADEAPPAAAKAPVERLTGTLIDTMQQAEALGFAGRRETLAPVLREVFDFAFMTRIAAGQHWSKLSAAEQERLVEHFARMSVATHASRFSGYSGQSFEVQAPEPGPRGAVLVPTQLNRPTGEPVKLDYLVREGENGAWQIIDVYLKGRYSELAIKRSEYTSVLAEAGVEELIARLQRKIEEMSAKPADAG